jgi:hypothetical protein
MRRESDSMISLRIFGPSLTNVKYDERYNIHVKKLFDFPSDQNFFYH